MSKSMKWQPRPAKKQVNFRFRHPHFDAIKIRLLYARTGRHHRQRAERYDDGKR